MKTRSRALLIAVVLTALGVAPALASTITVDEYGNVSFDSTPVLAVGSTPSLGFEYALPFSATGGTLFIGAGVTDFVGCVPGFPATR